MYFVSILLCTCLQEYDCLMVDEINDVRIIGVITAVVMMAVALAGLSWESKVTRQFIRSINQSVFIYIRQPEPIQARPIHIKRIKKSTYNTVQYYHTDRREKRETKSLLERDICCRSSHLYLSAISSNRGRANSLNIMVTLYNLLYLKNILTHFT